MASTTFLHRFGCIILLFAITACGEASNINGFMMTKGQKTALDVLVFKARQAYDKGDFATADEFANQAYEINPDNEEVAILSGYINLSMAGIDAFQLAKGLINKSSKSSGNADDALSPLASILGLTSEDLSTKVGTLQESKLATFASYPIIKPSCADDARIALDKLARANKAVQRVCPFVAAGLKLSSEPRHSATACVPSKNILHAASKANFLWAFSHLTEALAFYSAFSYSTTGDGVTNLQGRVNAVSALKPDSLAGIQELVTASTELAASIEDVLPVAASGICAGKTTQMVAMLNDLKATSLGFANLPGVPEKLTKSIVGAIDKIEQFSKNIPNTDQAASAQQDALKGQLTKAIAEKLGSKISDLKASNPDVSDEDISKMCDSFDSIAGAGAETGQVTKPTECG